jgi:hypothetical protein
MNKEWIKLSKCAISISELSINGTNYFSALGRIFHYNETKVGEICQNKANWLIENVFVSSCSGMTPTCIARRME